MKPIPVPKEIRDAPLPEGYVWFDGTEDRWPVLQLSGGIVGIATNTTARLLTSSMVVGFRLEAVPVENIDQAFALINARIILGDTL